GEGRLRLGGTGGGSVELGRVQTRGWKNHLFFQAEDGIRDYKVTGVQTCALPIWRDAAPDSRRYADAALDLSDIQGFILRGYRMRSEERRVGKECRSWGGPAPEKRRRPASRTGRRTTTTSPPVDVPPHRRASRARR